MKHVKENERLQCPKGTKGQKSLPVRSNYADLQYVYKTVNLYFLNLYMYPHQKRSINVLNINCGSYYIR